LQHLPGIDADNITGGKFITTGQFDDARLALELADYSWQNMEQQF
jgi:hypothetical protein